MRLHETIAAISTPPGIGGVGIVRVSGPEARRIGQALFRDPARRALDPPLPARTHRELFVGWLVDPATERPVDEVVMLAFVAPHSFTTEDVVELQGHAGPAVLQRTLELVLAQGARLAAPGEFTKRAFLGGRLDLTRAEAIADLTSARTERALALALEQLDGRLARAAAALREPLKHLLAGIEAAIDFPDEIDEPERGELVAAIEALHEEGRALLATAEGGRLLREGASLALVGRPNVGKSSLLNALLREERAIVTEEAGTTRDVVEASLALGGVPFRVLDTAGIREHAQAQAERLGIERSREALRRADLRLVVVEAGRELDPDEQHVLAAARAAGPTLVVVNKVDLAPASGAPSLPEGVAARRISARGGAGLAELEQAIYDLAVGQAMEPIASFALNARHRSVLVRTCEGLERARQGVLQETPLDLCALDLRDALGELGAITGERLTEEVIDHIFASFCVGK